jgi:hypothetical protein
MAETEVAAMSPRSGAGAVGGDQNGGELRRRPSSGAKLLGPALVVTVTQPTSSPSGSVALRERAG